MIAPLSIKSSHADCRPERSFFLDTEREVFTFQFQIFINNVYAIVTWRAP